MSDIGQDLRRETRDVQFHVINDFSLQTNKYMEKHLTPCKYPALPSNFTPLTWAWFDSCVKQSLRTGVTKWWSSKSGTPSMRTHSAQHSTVYKSLVFSPICLLVYLSAISRDSWFPLFSVVYESLLFLMFRCSSAQLWRVRAPHVSFPSVLAEQDVPGSSLTFPPPLPESATSPDS